MAAPQMLWLPTDRVLLDAIDQGSKSAGLTLRRSELANRALMVYRNDFGALVMEALRGMFETENFDALKLFPHTSTNIMRRVLDEVCRCYQDPPTRYLKGVEGEEGGVRSTAGGRINELISLSDLELLQQSEEATGPAEGEMEDADSSGGVSDEDVATQAEDPFDRWLALCDLDGLMAEVQRLGHILPALWIMPTVRLDGDGTARLDYDIYTPWTAGVDADPQDPTHAERFWCWVVERSSPTEMARVRYVWTATEFWKEDEKGRRLPNKLAPDGVNPLGRLPVVGVRLGRPLDSYYLDGQGGDLYDATLEVSVLRTLQNARYRDSSFKQIVIDGSPKDVPANQVMGNPALPIYVNEGSAQVLDLSPNFAAMSQVVREREEAIALRYGISPAMWTMTERTQSGFSKKMDNARILAFNRQDRKYLAAAEQELYKLTALRLAIEPVEAVGSLDPDAEFVVDYADPLYEEEPLKQAQADSRRVQLGIDNLVDIVMRENPDLTEEAVEALARNRIINERFGLQPKAQDVLDVLAGVAPSSQPQPGQPPDQQEPPTDKAEPPEEEA